MSQLTASTYMTRFRLFWEAANAVLKRRGKPPLTYFQARDWFDLEVEPDDLGELVQVTNRGPAEEASQ